ncbi:MAG: serine/threonine protein kinase [Deltaproteobacteria bacterium]|nr:serine/threonine protein kinase [Deltaproteobacteria bacterium]
MIGAARDPRTTVEGQIEGTQATAFGKYQLFASLGRGGMADVFLSVARGQMGFNKLAVIKRLRAALAEEAAFRNMFLDEARLAARLSHPNIVHTYEVGEQNGVYFIAMEYLEGQSLNKVLKEALRRKEVIEPEIGARIIADALSGLHYAHDLRDYDGRPLSIIHRDVSPHNIFVTYDGHTKLVDFGIAKAALSSTETEVGVLKGKVAYMSPEQAMGGRIDQRSDLFAMGIVLWELLARQRLMTGESAANTLHKLMNEPIPRVSQVVPTIDPELDAICAKALEKDPQVRWQSAAEMRDALEAWLRTRAQVARQEEVGRKMQHLFMSVREEVQRQIQRHMAALTHATNTTELQALTAESLRRMEQSGANVSGQLLRLGANGSGSGSGVVPNYGMGTHSSHASGYPSMTSHSMAGPPPQAKNNTLLIVIAVGFFLLAGLSIVVLGLNRGRRPDGEETGTSSGAVAAGTGVPVPVGTGVPSATTTAPPDPATPPTIDTGPTPSSTVALVGSGRTGNVRPPPTGGGVGGGRPSQPATPTTKTSSPVTAPPPAEAAEPGFVTLSSYPWSKVTEGGRVVCPATPCNKVQMSPGTHTLTFENADQGLKQTTTVTIKSGETVVRNLGLK